MEYQRDEFFPGETVRPTSPESAMQSNAPPLPPRANTVHLSPYSAPPPHYETPAPSYHSQPLTQSWSRQDPRSSSTQSLVPPATGREGKRTLLLIYIHGFMGNETSFQSFPAHIHNLVTIRLADTHVIHTKIYPKYKSRGAIEFARDDFSNWLCPHESPETDVILLGHSMGGILAAEVALLPPYAPTSKDPLRHRIHGTVSFDTPFLGMHPGVVVSGIGSLFKPSPESPGLKPQIPAENGGPMTPVLAISDRPSTSAVNPTSPTPINAQSPAASGYFGSATMSGSTSPETATTYTTMSSLASPVNDPNYNPPFPNDVRLPARKGWENTLHFIMKHSDGLTKATKSYVTSHFEFGGCLADYPGLKYRYTRLRGLEDVDELHPKANQAHVDLWRVRFVNYYTASTGRLKQANKVSPYGPHTGSQQFNASHSSMEQEMKDMTITTTSTRSPSRSPRISVEEHRDNEVIPIPLQDPEFYLPGSNHERLSSEDEASNVKTHMSNMDPRPVTDDEAQDTNGAPEGKDRISSELNADQTQGSPITFTATDASVQSLQPSMSLPPVPPEPSEPSPFDPSPYNDKAVRKLAEKDHSRQMKAYRQAIKDRDKAVRDRQKLLEKREKNARLAREKQVKLEEKQRLKDEKEESKRQVTLNPEAAPSKLKKPPPGTESGSTAVAEEKAIKAEKAKRDRKFCTLPPKNPDGSRDPCWVRIYMEGVDEVGAHVGLFIAQNPHYEKLVGDVGARIEEWVREAADVREVRKRLRVKGGGGGAREGFAAFWAGEEE